MLFQKFYTSPGCLLIFYHNILHGSSESYFNRQFILLFNIKKIGYNTYNAGEFIISLHNFPDPAIISLIIIFHIFQNLQTGFVFQQLIVLFFNFLLSSRDLFCSISFLSSKGSYFFTRFFHLLTYFIYLLTKLFLLQHIIIYLRGYSLSFTHHLFYLKFQITSLFSILFQFSI